MSFSSIRLMQSGIVLLFVARLRTCCKLSWNSRVCHSLLMKKHFCGLYSHFQIGGGHNSHQVVLKVAEMVIRESRATRVQPFNEYRKRFNLKPYTSFDELTGKLKKYEHMHAPFVTHYTCVAQNAIFACMHFLQPCSNTAHLCKRHWALCF